MNKKTVAIIGTNGLPARYGGWDHLLMRLTEDLQDQFSFTVYTSSHNAVKGLSEYNGAKIKVINLKANGIQSVPYDIISMVHAVFRYDVLLILGTSGCIFLPVIRWFGKKIVLNPDGAEWKRGKWGAFAKWFLKLSERFGVKYSDTVIADNRKIYEFIQKEYGVESELIEYGGDNARYVELRQETADLYGVEKGRYAFKVCRIEPENNIDIILEAFKGQNVKLILIGNWNNSAYGKNTKEKYTHFPNLILLDPIYDQTQLDELRSNCGIYVHGHSVGGTNPSLVEAMNLGLCCVVYGIDYNVETTEGAAIYFDSVQSLQAVLSDFEAKKFAPAFIGSKMNEIAKRRYVWRIITEKYAKVLNS